MSKKEYPTTTPDWRTAVKRRTRFYVLMAVLLAIIFGILVFQFFARQQRIAPGSLISAVFASQDIKAGTVIMEGMIEIRDVSVLSVPDSHLMYKEQAIGKSALYPLSMGEVVLPEKLAGKVGGLVASRCPSGKWCVSVPLDWFIAAPPDLAEGDMVEIASSLPGGNPGETGFIAAGVQVVLIPENEGSPAFIFALDDQEALSLLYARSNQFQLLALLRPTEGD
ncbi:MAG: hypothetical protein J7L35_01530 [Anaerolineales bacterium]|nr:hypothetical protein [Anaerolineales bacterium]